MKRPELSDYGLTEADVVAINRYDKILQQRKESRQLLKESPFAFFFMHTFVGLIFFIFVISSNGTSLKGAIAIGAIPCVWTIVKTLFINFWHKVPPLYFEKKKALNDFHAKETEFAKYFEEQRVIEAERCAKAKAAAKEVAARAARAAEKEKKVARMNLEYWQALDGVTFEKELAALLRDSGYKEVSLTSVTGDDGIDLWATDPDDNPCILQCKAYQNTVSPSQVRELLGSLKAVEDKANYAIMVALSGITGGAEKFAEKNGILVWDGDMLVEMAKNVIGKS